MVFSNQWKNTYEEHTMKRAEYVARLGGVTDTESLKQAIWDADDHTWDVKGFDDEDFDPVMTARRRQATVQMPGFEFTHNTVAEELRAAVEVELNKAADQARAARLAELQA
jgi:hypothetical protein